MQFPIRGTPRYPVPVPLPPGLPTPLLLAFDEVPRFTPQRITQPGHHVEVHRLGLPGLDPRESALVDAGTLGKLDLRHSFGLTQLAQAQLDTAHAYKLCVRLHIDNHVPAFICFLVHMSLAS